MYSLNTGIVLPDRKKAYGPCPRYPHYLPTYKYLLYLLCQILLPFLLPSSSIVCLCMYYLLSGTAQNYLLYRSFSFFPFFPNQWNTENHSIRLFFALPNTQKGSTWNNRQFLQVRLINQPNDRKLHHRPNSTKGGHKFRQKILFTIGVTG